MEGQALKAHCSAAAGFLPKSGGGGGGGGRRNFFSSCWSPPARFLRHDPKRNGGRISVEIWTPPLRSIPPLSLQQEEFVEGNDEEEEGASKEEEEEEEKKSKVDQMMKMVSGGGGGGGRSRSTVHVKFVLHKECSFGERFLLVGDDPMFGLWDLKSAIPLNWSEGHFWTAEMDLPLEKSIIQFKFILGDASGEEFHWQPGPDRVLQIWDTPNTIVVTEDWDKADNQKITEEGEESITNNNNNNNNNGGGGGGGGGDAVQLLVSCGLTSVDPSSQPPIADHFPNDDGEVAEDGKLMAAADHFPNDDDDDVVVENENPLFTSEKAHELECYSSSPPR